MLLLGRQAECARIDQLLADARGGRSGALVLLGEPGIGKSAMCAYAGEQARGMTVLSARGVESEADLPFAGLTELFRDRLQHIGDVPKPQADALRAAFALADGHPVDRLTMGAAVLSLLAAIADAAPALAVFDDAQWLDSASAAAALFAARRLDMEGVVMVMSVREGSGEEWLNRGLPVLRLRGLGAAHADALLRVRHPTPIPPAVCRRLVAATGGNPLALLEVPALLDAAQLAGDRPLDEPLPVGPALEQAFLRRVAPLPAPTRRGLLLAAASGGAELRPVLDGLSAVALGVDVLDEAQTRKLISVSDGSFEFRHPLLRSAVYHGAALVDRRAAHRTLAQVTQGERRAWHIAAAAVDEDEDVARSLEHAGDEARRHGAPGAAARALERAARLSPDVEQRARRLTAGARDAYDAGRPGEAMELLSEALNATGPGVRRAEIQHLRGRILVMQGHSHEAYQLLWNEAALVRRDDPDRAAGMLAEAVLECLGTGDVPRAVDTGRAAVDAAGGAGPHAQALASVMLACALALVGESDEALTLAFDALPLLEHVDPLTEAGELVVTGAHAFVWLERYPEAERLYARVIDRARAASAPAALAYALAARAELNLRTGDWLAAGADADEAARLADDLSQVPIRAFARDSAARLAAMTGEESRCREIMASIHALVAPRPRGPGTIYVTSIAGLLALGLRQVDEAIGHLEHAGRLAAACGLRDPSVIQWQADLVEAYVRAGRVEDARAVLTALAAEGGRAQRISGLAAAARCRGLVADDDHFEAAFRAALELHDQLPVPFERARTELCLGERLRRAGRRRQARVALRAAIEAFDRLGAAPWADRARIELLATGETARARRQPAADRLTPHELQVALVVADGATNREAAAALFVSPKTIEYHLGRVYRKLGLRSRSQLAALLASETQAESGR